jgi:hypothetical protein
MADSWANTLGPGISRHRHAIVHVPAASRFSAQHALVAWLLFVSFTVRRRPDEIEHVVDGAVQHSVDNLAERYEPVAHPSYTGPIESRQRLESGTEALGRDIESEQNPFGPQYRAGGARLRDPYRIDNRVLVDSESRDTVGGGVQFVAKAGEAFQPRAVGRGHLDGTTPPVRIHATSGDLAGEDKEPFDRPARLGGRRRGAAARRPDRFEAGVVADLGWVANSALGRDNAGPVMGHGSRALRAWPWFLGAPPKTGSSGPALVVVTARSHCATARAGSPIG